MTDAKILTKEVCPPTGVGARREVPSKSGVEETTGVGVGVGVGVVGVLRLRPEITSLVQRG